MTTPSTIDALEMAIRKLTSIEEHGGILTGRDRHELQRMRDARDAHREQEMKDEATRRQLRELRGKMRGLAADMNATVDRSTKGRA